MSLRLRLLKFWLRSVEKPRLARATPLAARAGFEKQAAMFRDPPLALFLPGALGGVPVLWASAGPGNRPPRIPGKPQLLLWCHGGAHVMGSPRTHRALVARLSAMTGLAAVIPDYRLAPEHAFPASLEDMLVVWEGLMALGYRPGEVVLGGDSSGGGVMLALLAQLLARGERPAKAALLAPFTDLTGAGESFRSNADRDPFLPAARLGEVLELFLAGAHPKDPRASPLFAAFPDCPPVFLQVARTEILRDDSLRMAGHLRGFGAEVTLDLWEDCPHVWAMFQGLFPEAEAAVKNIAGFIRQQPRAG